MHGHMIKQLAVTDARHPLAALALEQAPEFAKSGLPVHELTNWYKGLTGRDREIVFRLTGYMLPAHA